MKKGISLLIACIILFSTACNKADRIKWRPFSKALIEQEKNEKIIMFYFYSTSCMYCKLMQSSTLNEEEISRIINSNFIPVKLNIDNTTPMDNDLPSPSHLAATFKVNGVPAIYFVDKDYKVVKAITGYQPVYLFKKHLKEVLKDKVN